MAGYIGPRSQVVSSTSIAKAQDFTATDTTPEVTIVNNTHEDTDGGREGKVIFKGQQSGGEESTLAEIEANHSGSSDDEKGQLVFKTNDGNDGATPTEAMRINSLGNVGIGTASVDVSTQAGGSGYKALQIESDEGGQLNFDHNDAGTGSTLGQINFQRAGEVVAEIEGVTDGATDNGRLAFRTQPDGGALIEAMRIDHNGYITKPKQCVFLVKPTSDQNDFAINADTTVVWGTEVYDVGSNFASNVFTAPVTGKYQLNVQLNFINVDVDSEYVNVWIEASNRSNVYTYGSSAGDVDTYQTVAFSILMDMDANDQSWVKVNMPNSGAAQMDISTYSFFSGHLVA